MLHASKRAVIELLEGRRLFCLFNDTTTPAADSATPAPIAMPAGLAVNQVTGTYRGSAVDVMCGGMTVPLRLVITKTSARLTATGYGSATISLSKHSFNRIRDGRFSFTGVFGSSTIALSGTITKAGKLISGGTFTATGSKAFDGSFSLKKI